jgi:YidC/Oxa1 family membrane protein insertase
MEKRALLAIGLAFIILLAYQFFFVPPQPVQTPQQPVTEDRQQKPATAGDEKGTLHLAPPSAEAPAPRTALTGDEDIRVETLLYSAVFSSKGASIRHFQLKHFTDKEGDHVVLLNEPAGKAPLSIGAKSELELADVTFAVSRTNLNLDQDTQRASLVFHYTTHDISVKRTYTFAYNSYRIDIRDEVTGLPDYLITIGADFGIHEKEGFYTHVGPVLLKEADREEFSADGFEGTESYTEQLKWIAIEDKYFFASLVPVSPAKEARVWKQGNEVLIGLRGSSGVNDFILYAGPKEYETLKSLNLGLEHIVDFGFFSILAIPLFWMLKFFYQLTGNYGWAIIIITLILRIPFIPLINKSQRSMKKMQEIQPKMAEVKEKYKKDPQKMNKEMMELYKKHKVNPVGGCLPMLLQIPFFFALYKILLISIELRGAPFMLWIHDLSAPDTLFGHIPASIPLIGGFALGPLPILMGATMILQQKMTPTSLDPTQNRLMMLMPVVFTFLFLNFASGLVLYWLMNNIFSIIQQFFANRKLAKEKN